MSVVDHGSNEDASCWLFLLLTYLVNERTMRQIALVMLSAGFKQTLVRMSERVVSALLTFWEFEGLLAQNQSRRVGMHAVIAWN